MSIPRIRGRTAQITEGEDKNKWLYEISLWDLSGEHLVGEPLFFGPFDNQELARSAGTQIVKDVSQHIEKEKTGEISGRYLDMKNGGIMRPWVNQ